MERIVELPVSMSHDGPPPPYSKLQPRNAPPIYPGENIVPLIDQRVGSQTNKTTDSTLNSVAPGPPQKRGKHCTRSRCCVAFASILIIAAIILGATSGLLKRIGKNSNSNTKAAKSEKAISTIAAAECGEGNLFVFYQDMTSSLYMYTSLKEVGNWTEAEKLNGIPGFVDIQGSSKVNMTINNESPLSAICWMNGTDIELRLYYLDKSLFSNEITGKVSANLSMPHTLTSHRITPIVGSCSKSLVAAYLPAIGIKLYCLNSREEIHELTYSNASVGWTQTTEPIALGAGFIWNAPPRMAVAVQGNGTSEDTQIHLFYHVYYTWPEEKNGITTTSWDAVTGLWSSARVIELLFSEDDRLETRPKPLAACLTSSPFSIHVFHTENFRAHEIVFSEGAWLYERTIDAIDRTDMPISDGGKSGYGGTVASLAWKGDSGWQIRLFYAYDAKVRMAAFERESWTEGVKIDGS